MGDKKNPDNCVEMKCCPRRESAKEMLLSESKRLRETARNFEKLADSLYDLSPEADEALWQLVINMRRI